MTTPGRGANAVAITGTLAALSWVFACELPKSTAGDGGASAGSADADTTATGAYCGKDPESGATLCSAISLCPSLVFDGDAWPGCGFRIRGQVIDMECACNGSLCPVGVATTCTEAQALIDAQTEPQVCLQVGDGRCVATAPSSGTPSTCDRTCAAQCGGDPSCVQICGC